MPLLSVLSRPVFAFALLGSFVSLAIAEEIRIVSYNILSYGNNGSGEYSALVRIVQTLNPDILMFQEANNDNGRIAFQTAFQSVYPFRALSQADAAGLRQHTYSRWPLANPVNLFVAGFTRPTLRVDVDTDPANPGQELRLYNLHLNAGSTSDDQIDRFNMAIRIRDDIVALRAIDPDYRIVVAGDFNEQPGENAFLQLVAPTFDLELNDEQDPNNGSFMTRPASGRNIDHFLVSRTVDAALVDTSVFNTLTFQPNPPPLPSLLFDSSTASDHLAIVLDFDLLTFVPGDMNLDGFVTVTDIGPFVTALTDPALYRSQFPAADLLEAGDLNGDGAMSVGDIGAFVAELTGG